MLFQTLVSQTHYSDKPERVNQEKTVIRRISCTLILLNVYILASETEVVTC